MHIIKIYLLVLLDCSISVFPIALFNVSYKKLMVKIQNCYISIFIAQF